MDFNKVHVILETERIKERECSSVKILLTESSSSFWGFLAGKQISHNSCDLSDIRSTNFCAFLSASFYMSSLSRPSDLNVLLKLAERERRERQMHR